MPISCASNAAWWIFDNGSPLVTTGCPSCSSVADGFDETHLHLQNHDVAFTAVSRAPLAKLQDYKRRMGWSFPWASSFESDLNHDFHVTHTEREWQSGAVEYNFRTSDLRPSEESPGLIEMASVGTLFRQRLIDSGILTAEDAQSLSKEANARYESAFVEVKAAEEQKALDQFAESNVEFQPAYSHAPVKTAISKETP